jgi:hypothetical protein
VTNSVATVGQLVTTSSTGQQVTVPIAEGQNLSPTTVAAGGVAFNPLTSGTTTVSVTIAGFIATNAATVQVTVSAPGITLFGLPRTVGAGLQVACCTARLGASNHGGVTVRLESSAPGVALLAPNATTAGTAFIEVLVPNGSTDVGFVVQGREGARGTATITASAAGFTNSTGPVTVVQAAVRLEGLSAAITTLSADAPFFVRLGTPNANNTDLAAIQEARVGGGGVTATVTNSVATVGQLVTTSSTGQQVTVPIAEGQNLSPTTVAAGGVAFDPLTSGTTTVAVTIAGFIATNAATVQVTVSP